MNLNDKFLNVCFKLGKVIFSVLLLIALIVTLVLWVNTGFSYSQSNKIKVKYEYNVKNIINDMYAYEFGINPDKNKDVAAESKISKKEQIALDIYSKFLADNKLPASYKDKINLPSDDKEKVPFVKCFIVFHDSFKTEFSNFLKKTGKFNDKQIKSIIDNNTENLFKDAMNAYVTAYNSESELVNNEKQQADLKKQASLIGALISLAIFILFLFLPILIRIEENTRK